MTSIHEWERIYARERQEEAEEAKIAMTRFDKWFEQQDRSDPTKPITLRMVWAASRKAALLEAAEYINGSIPGNTASLYLKRMAEDK